MQYKHSFDETQLVLYQFHNINKQEEGLKSFLDICN